MNWAASDLVDRKELRGAVQNERLIGRREQGQGSCTRQKNRLVMAMVYQAHYLTSADQVIPD